MTGVPAGAWYARDTRSSHDGGRVSRAACPSRDACVAMTVYPRPVTLLTVEYWCLVGTEHGAQGTEVLGVEC